MKTFVLYQYSRSFILNRIFMGTLFLLLVTGCTKTENFIPSAINAPLVLKVADSTGNPVTNAVLVLNQANQNNPALIFNWTTGSNHQTGNAITYILQIDKTGNNFSKALSNNMGKAIYTSSYTAGAFNTLLQTFWSDTTAATLNLQARVYTIIGDGSGIKGDTSAVVNITVTPYIPVSTKLYIIGNATPTGWSANNADSLTPDATIPGLFHFQGTLSPGNFKFLTALNGNFLPSYNMGADSAHLFYRTLSSQPDNQFLITVPNFYYVDVNLISLTIKVTKAALPLYKQLWIVGDATPNGWNINSPNQMYVDLFNPYVFHYNEVLAAGNFKIPTALGNWGGDYYRPLTNLPSLTDTTAALVFGNTNPPDNQWKITNAGPYKISLNIMVNSIHISPFTPFKQLWMVGDATPSGWNINAPTPMVPTPGNPYQFTYSGNLTVGEFKIPTTTGNFGCNYFRPDINHPALTDNNAPYVTVGSGPADANDYKWNITVAGNYTITFNQLYETISIIKQ